VAFPELSEESGNTRNLICIIIVVLLQPTIKELHLNTTCKGV